jgi:hypothetical protein
MQRASCANMKRTIASIVAAALVMFSLAGLYTGVFARSFTAEWYKGKRLTVRPCEQVCLRAKLRVNALDSKTSESMCSIDVPPSH